MSVAEWEKFKLLVDTNRGYVDIVVKATAIYGGISAGILGFFGGGADLRTLTVADPSLSLLVFGFGTLFGLVFLFAAVCAWPVAFAMDKEMRKLAAALDATPASHGGILKLALVIAILIFTAAMLIFGALTFASVAALISGE